MVQTLLGALTWDPQIRGASIVFIAVVVLCGSVYLLLATNTGAKLGFLLAAAGLAGWMFLMGLVWILYGIGLRGPTAAWHVEDVLVGDPARSPIEETANFPEGWTRLEPGNTVLADAQATADAILVPDTGAGGHGAEDSGAHHPAVTIDPPFEEAGDYVVVGGYETGGEPSLFPGGAGPEWGPFNSPRYVIVQVAPAMVQPETGGAPPTPRAEPGAELTNVIVVRDLGARRLPAIILTVAMGALFALLCNVLHRRDRAVMAARAATPAAA